MLWKGWKFDLADLEPEERLRAAQRLGDGGKSAWRAAPALADLVLGDHTSDVRSKAAWALGKIRNDHKKVLHALVLALADDINVRDMATRSLTRIRGPAIQVLAWHLAREDLPAVRISICHTLGLIGPRANEVAGALVNAAADESDRVRSTALFALGMIGPRCQDCAHVIVGAFFDESPYVRLRATVALYRVRGDTDPRPAMELLRDPDPDVRELAAATLGQLGPYAVTAVGALAQAMEDEQPTVSLAALCALKRVGPPHATTAIVAIEAFAGRHPQHAEAADEVLEQLRHPA